MKSFLKQNQEKLPSKIKDIYNMDVKIDIKKVEYGSISVFFGAIIQGVQLIASYKSFIDSVYLIKEHTQELIEQLMKEKYGNDFSVGVDIKYPRFEKH
jgi:capsular polysaccharide biosynthesis protein